MYIINLLHFFLKLGCGSNAYRQISKRSNVEKAKRAPFTGRKADHSISWETRLFVGMIFKSIMRYLKSQSYSVPSADLQLEKHPASSILVLIARLASDTLDEWLQAGLDMRGPGSVPIWIALISKGLVAQTGKHQKAMTGQKIPQNIWLIPKNTQN